MARWVAGRGKDASTGQLGPLVGVLAGCPWVGGGDRGGGVAWSVQGVQGVGQVQVGWMGPPGTGGD